MSKVAFRENRWKLDYYDNLGKRVIKTIPKGTTKKKAEEKLRGILDKLQRGIYMPENRIPNFSVIAQDWLKFKKPKKRAASWSGREGHIRNHFADFNDLRIDRISTALVENWITERQEQKMNISTLRKVINTLNQIFNYALRHGYIYANPLTIAERPKSKGLEVRRKIKPFTIERVNALFDAEKYFKYKTLYMLAVFSGARQGELVGLKWSDILWDEGQIHFQRTYNNQAWDDTKSGYSNRKVDIGPSMMRQLKRWKVACPPSKLNLVFPNKVGNPIDHNNLMKRHFIPAAAKAELDSTRFHNLRHTFASILIDQGESIPYIQTQLGHSKPSTTLNYYAHLMKSDNRDSARRLEDRVLGNR